MMKEHAPDRSVFSLEHHSGCANDATREVFLRKIRTFTSQLSVGIYSVCKRKKIFHRVGMKRVKKDSLSSR